MNVPLRFRVEVDRAWCVRVVDGEGVALSDARSLRRLSTAGEPAFPLPPAGEAIISPLLSDEDPQAIGTAYDDILARRGSRVEDFGRYLFDTLIGDVAWRAMREYAAEQSARNVELALCWDPGDLELHRLSWEMMHTGDAFLAAGTPGFAVAITRVVSGTGHVAQRSLEPPARLLFVVGTALSDPDIRPAAELVGLIRRLRRNSGRLHARMLEHASPERIREAVASFKPDIVHFVGHGSRDAEGRSYLELEPDDDDGETARPASQLVQYLNRDGVLPAVVVLSACYTAGAQIVQAGAHETGPMAAELIQLGVPVVLGMAGRVSDRICRLFTRRFGEALANGEPLVTATAHARRVGLADGAPPDSSVDWGFPALFLAEGVEPSYVPVMAQPNDPAIRIQEWITGYDLEEQPVFCGREEYLHAYNELFRRPGEPAPRHQVLAVYVRQTNHERQGRCGRTRLLKELAIHALHDGHVPVLVTVPASSEPPRTPEALGAAVSAAITQVRSDSVLALGRKRGQLDLMRRTTEEALRADELDGDIAYELESHGAWTAHAVRRAIQLDLLSLRRDAAQQCPTTADGQVVVLLDEVESYAGVLEDLFGTLLNGYGLGTPREPVPVVLAFSLGQATNDVLVPIAEQRFTKPWLRAMPLEPFRDGEDMLAYELVLLNPYKELPDDEERIASRSWAFNPSVAPEVRTFWENQFRRKLKGFPDALGSEDLYELVTYSQREQFVVDADDEAFLRRMPFE